MKKAGSEFTPRCLAPQRQPRLYCLRFRRRPARRRDAGVLAPGDADQAEQARTEQPDATGIGTGTVVSSLVPNENETLEMIEPHLRAALRCHRQNTSRP